MRSLLLSLLLILGVVVAQPLPALATGCSVPNVFSNGTTADANQVNANFSALVNCGNNIDNTNIGGNGIYASQIKPTTTGQGTFGGAIGYTFNPNAVGQVSLTITNAASPTVDYLDVQSSTGTKYLSVDKNGVLNTNGAPVFGGVPTWTGAIPVAQGGTGATSLSAAHIAVTNANNNFSSAQTFGSGIATDGATPTANGLIGGGTGAALNLYSAASAATAVSFTMNQATGNSNDIVWFRNNATTTVASVGNNGGIKASVNGSALSFVPPVYTAAGAAVASSLHGVIATCTVPNSGATCSVTLTGAAVFSSASSYSCSVSTNTAGSGTFGGLNNSASQFSAVWSTTQSGGATMEFFCAGT